MNFKAFTVDLFKSIGNSYFVGTAYFGNALQQTGKITFFNASSALGTDIQAGNTTAAITYVLPTAGPAANNYLLGSSTAGVLSWINAAGTYAPLTPSYVTLATDATLPNERVLTGTANQVILTDNGAGGTIVLSLPQSINVAATPTFASLTLTATTNQLILGTTRTSTITAPTPATTSRVYTFPDLTGDYSVVATIGTQTIAGSKTFSSPVLIPDGTAGAPGLAFSTAGNLDNGIYRIGTDNWGLAAAGAGVWTTTAAGEINHPLQPSFLATSTGAADVTGDGTLYTVTFDTEIYDQGADYNNATYTFTAPVTGRYYLQGQCRQNQLTALHTTVRYILATSNREYRNTLDVTALSFNTLVESVSALADMDANDTAVFQIQTSGSTKTVDVDSSATLNFFSGSLVN